MSQGRLWYVRRAKTVRGPFPAALIKRYMLLGRVKPTDELSLDQQSWLPVTAYPGFAPDQGTASGLAAVAASVVASEDERKPGDRRQGQADPHSERRQGADRRAEEPPEVIERRTRRARVVASLRVPGAGDKVAALIAGLLLIGVIAGGFLFAPGAPESAPQCEAKAAPAVNWANCRKEGAELANVDLRNGVLRNARLTGVKMAHANLMNADLAYVDLVGADLSYGRLDGARMTGANLRKADLGYASLKGADLSYVDLTEAVLGGAMLEGAILDNVIWPDGQVCGKGSVGACLPR